MSDSNRRGLNIDIDKDVWKKLKKISIDKEISLNQLICEILQKWASKKGGEEEA